MKNNKLIFLALIGFIFGMSNVRGQSVNYEQIAFDHFFRDIFPRKFNNKEKVGFSGCTEVRPSGYGVFSMCFSEADELMSALKAKSRDLVQKKPINIDNVKGAQFNKRRPSSKISLYMEAVNEINGLFYVRIDIYKLRKEVFYYLFEMNAKGEIIRWCESSAIH